MQGPTDHEKALAVDGGQRAQLVADMFAAATFLQHHLEVPGPARLVVNVPVPPGDGEAREAFVAGFAAALGVLVTTGPAGTVQASRPFGASGRVVLETHVTPVAVQERNLRAVLHGERAA